MLKSKIDGAIFYEFAALVLFSFLLYFILSSNIPVPRVCLGSLALNHVAGLCLLV